jgi:hypothetical protein
VNQLLESDSRLARRYPVASRFCPARGSSCTWTVARVAADLTVDVRWKPVVRSP